MPVPCLKAGPQVGTCPSVLSLVFQGHPPSLLLPASTPLHHYCSSGLPGGSVLCWPGLRSTGTFWLPAALHLLSRIKVAVGSMFLPEWGFSPDLCSASRLVLRWALASFEGTEWPPWAPGGSSLTTQLSPVFAGSSIFVHVLPKLVVSDTRYSPLPLPVFPRSLQH